MKRILKDDFSIKMLSSSILFYFFFAFYDGTVICVDSPSYISMDRSREPFYPLLLALFRKVFGGSGGEGYLFGVVLFQSLLAALAAYAIVECARKEFKTSKIESVLILLLPLSVSLLCRFAAGRASMYSNSIMTEGIAIPLYLLFFCCLLEYVINYGLKSLMASVLLVFVLISTRKQMYITIPMLGVAILYVELKKNVTKIAKSVIGARVARAAGIWLLSVVISLGGSMLLDVGYNYVLRNEATTHSSDIRFIATVAFYTAERGNGESIEDAKVRDLFYEIFDTCNEKGYLGHSAGEGWTDRVSHFGDHYDNIQIDVMWSAVNRFVREEYGCEDSEINKYADHIMDIISRSVIPCNLGRVFVVFMDNFRAGLVTTVAQRKHILNIYSVLIYIVYFLLLYINIKFVKDRKVVLAAILTLLSILFNVGLVSCVIFCQTRYTIYNMPLFYISLLLMISCVIKAFCKEMKGNHA